jgi:hypothetical protein
MSGAEANGGPFEVHASGVILQAFKEVQQQASFQGRGAEVLRAFRQIHHRLIHDPLSFGEPLYRLPALRMEIRSVVIGPVGVFFGVCEDRPLFFVNGVRLLEQPPV